MRLGALAKIARPKTSGAIHRKRLFRVLDQARRRPVVWVSSPAGSGKTILLASYLDSRKLPCLWYHVDARDDDLATFFYYLRIAAKTAVPRCRKPLPLFTPEYLGGIPQFTRRYFEGLFGRLTPPYVVVFDDYQEASSGAALPEAIGLATEVLPEGITIAVLSRSDPPRELARLRANEQLALIGWDDIKFTLEESRRVVTKEKRGVVSEDALRLLHEKTDGWVAGMVLMMESARTRRIEPRLLDQLPRGDIFDYFAREIFAKAEPGVRRFLMVTAFLPSVTPSVAERLTGIENAEEVLERLSRNHFFTQKNVESTPAYRYHPLFREFLLACGERSFDRPERLAILRSAASLLEETGQYEDAVALIRGSEDWAGLTRMVLTNAQKLISQGRNRTLCEWIQAVPGGVLDSSAWLLYWLGKSRMPFDLAASRSDLERAFRLFASEGEETGALLAWSEAVDAIILEWKDYSQLDFWADWLDAWVKRGDRFPSWEVEARVASSFLWALLWRRPSHPRIGDWAKRVVELVRDGDDIDLCVKGYITALWFYGWTGDLAGYELASSELRRAVRSPSVSPLVRIAHAWSEAILCCFASVNPERSMHFIREGLRLSDREGIHINDHWFYAQGAAVELCREDRLAAAPHLEKTRNTLANDRASSGHWHFLIGLRDFMAGNVPSALLHAQQSLNVCEECGQALPMMLCHFAISQMLHGAGEAERADGHIARAGELARDTRSGILEFMCLLGEARFALDRGDDPACLGLLRRALSLGRARGYTSILWWPFSRLATELCRKALEAGIEPEYVKKLIRSNGLRPGALQLRDEIWPRAVRIQTLGQFRIVKDGAPVVFVRKVQKKPLELLKALVAFGSEEVPAERLAEALWPDADGDRAHKSFENNLKRLRRLVGEEQAIVLRDGRVTINPDVCFVDVWMLEHATLRWTAASEGGRLPANDVVAYAERALDLCRGDFLLEDPYDWVIRRRAALRETRLRLVARLAECGLGRATPSQ